jgi:hypothetical protein
MPRAKFSSQALKSARNSSLSIGYVLSANSKVDVIQPFPGSEVDPVAVFNLAATHLPRIIHLIRSLDPK